MKTDPQSKEDSFSKTNRIFNPLADATATKPKAASTKEKPEPFRVWTLGQLRKLEVPEEFNLVGDFHIHRHGTTVLVGGWGLGKSFASLTLAVMGAEGSGNWLGYEVRRKFKTLIIQSENSYLRLILDSKRLALPEEFDEHVKIIEFDFGQADINDAKVFDGLQKLIREGGFGLIVIDPWNAFTSDVHEKDIKAALRRVMSLAAGMEREEVPAFLVMTHVKKARDTDNHQGRQNAEKAAGSYVLLSSARCVLSYDPYSHDLSENRVVVYCTKKNLGKNVGTPTAWQQVDGGFQQIEGFDYDEWKENTSKKGREPKAKLRLEHLRQALASGALTRKELGKRLMALANVTDSTVSDHLKEGGIWRHMLEITGGMLWSLKAEFREGGDDDTDASPFD